MSPIPTIRYGTFDGDPCMFTAAEAYVLTNGVWHEAEPFTMWHEARVNNPPGYVMALLRNAPALPEDAFRTLADY